jgi:Spy/CpxP family protein refolding chaperone
VPPSLASASLWVWPRSPAHRAAVGAVRRPAAVVRVDQEWVAAEWEARSSLAVRTPVALAPEGPPRSGLQLGPPGQRWWDDKSYVKSLKLRPEQQTRMDAIFEQNRAALLSRFEGVQQAEAQMEQLSNSPAPDEAALFAQIDRVAQTRAELEKANTHMLLQLRKEMDADQIKRLEKYR